MSKLVEEKNSSFLEARSPRSNAGESEDAASFKGFISWKDGLQHFALANSHSLSSQIACFVSSITNFRAYRLCLARATIRSGFLQSLEFLCGNRCTDATIAWKVLEFFQTNCYRLLRCSGLVLRRACTRRNQTYHNLAQPLGE